MHEKTHNKNCVTCDDSDQPAHSCSLIRVFADRMCLLQLQAIQRGINEKPWHTRLLYRLIWVFAGYTGRIVDFVERCLITNKWILIIITYN